MDHGCSRTLSPLSISNDRCPDRIDQNSNVGVFSLSIYLKHRDNFKIGQKERNRREREKERQGNQRRNTDNNIEILYANDIRTTPRTTVHHQLVKVSPEKRDDDERVRAKNLPLQIYTYKEVLLNRKQGQLVRKQKNERNWKDEEKRAKEIYAVENMKNRRWSLKERVKYTGP